jgi:hypothetical protein
MRARKVDSRRKCSRHARAALPPGCVLTPRSAIRVAPLCPRVSMCAFSPHSSPWIAAVREHASRRAIHCVDRGIRRPRGGDVRGGPGHGSAKQGRGEGPCPPIRVVGQPAVCWPLFDRRAVRRRGRRTRRARSPARDRRRCRRRDPRHRCRRHDPRGEPRCPANLRIRRDGDARPERQDPDAAALPRRALGVPRALSADGRPQDHRDRPRGARSTQGRLGFSAPSRGGGGGRRRAARLHRPRSVHARRSSSRPSRPSPPASPTTSARR